jgi:hypothetical protein
MVNDETSTTTKAAATGQAKEATGTAQTKT